MSSVSLEGRLLVQLTTYNTNLQDHDDSLPQDLVDWLRPTLTVSKFLAPQLSVTAPDIVCVGFQELLPLHIGLSGWSNKVLASRDAHIKSQLEQHAPNKERYTLVAKVVNVGVAMLVYARDDKVGKKFTDVQTSWIGIGGPLAMGNKGAVAIRFRVPDEDGGVGETFTFVCAHLSAHAHLLERRISDYQNIVSSLVFPSKDKKTLSTIYDTSHLFFVGDLNFRVVLPPEHALSIKSKDTEFATLLESEDARKQMRDHDQLSLELKKGTVLQCLKEGDFWKFKCSYKFKIGHVERYSSRRTPSWTDRILYATHTDDPSKPTESNISNLLYTSIPSYCTSDHKPIVALLLLPPSKPDGGAALPPVLKLPPGFTPTPNQSYMWKRFTGRTTDRFIGIIWYIFSLFGAGSFAVGIFNFILGFGAWKWWSTTQNVTAQTV
ncbi:Endonuclease/exonuclease/phosphatase [Flagelloscypha sp. PMI_526]|nr:Endonuclease/exonuclease/phosphatase [Flagelloscypha sp. PMI_526]